MQGEQLTPAEIVVLLLIADGQSDVDTATMLCVAPSTIHTHCLHLFGKTGCHSRVQLTRYAVAHGYVSTDWRGSSKSTE